jgi:MOSC domain-containing protein YiiM
MLTVEHQAMSNIYSIVYQPEPTPHEEPFRYLRVPVQSVTLIAGHGIDGDRKAGHNPARQLNIMFYETVQALANEGFKAAPGELGEQIIVQGLTEADLTAGDRLRLGDTLVEMVKTRTGCDWFKEIHQQNPPAQRLGYMAKILEGGIINVGDSVELIRVADTEEAV